jgi:acetyl/propionyl-CoA carboxylase alpha subunit
MCNVLCRAVSCCVVLCCVLHAPDPMIAKIVTHSHDRDSALALLRQALAETQVGWGVWV